MINFAKASDKSEFIVGTETDMIHRLSKEVPDKTFYPVKGAVCPTMKLITLDNIISALETLTPEVIVDPEIAERAREPLRRMLEIGRA